MSNTPAAPPTDYVKLLLTRKNIGLIAGSAMLCLVLATLANLLTPERYEARTTLVLSPPPYKDKQEGTIGKLMPETLHVKDIEVIVTCDAVLSKTLEELEIGGQIPQDEMEALKEPGEFVDLLRVDTTEIAKSATTGATFSKVINLAARGDTRETSECIAKTWAKVAQQVILDYMGGTSTETFDFLEREFNDATDNLVSAEDSERSTQDGYDQKVSTHQKDTATQVGEHRDASDMQVRQFEDETDQQLREFRDKSDLEIASYETETDILLQKHQDSTAELLKKKSDEWSDKLAKLRAELKLDELQARLGWLQQRLYGYTFSVGGNTGKKTEQTSDKALAALFGEVVPELAASSSGQSSSTGGDLPLSLEDQKMELMTRRAQLEGQIKEATAELEKHPEVLVLSKAITDDALWQKSNANGETGGIPKSLDALKLRSEIINPTYLQLMQKLSDARVALNALPKLEAMVDEQITAKQKDYADTLGEYENKTFQLQEQERQRNMEIEILKRERDVDEQKLDRDRTVGQEALVRQRRTEEAVLQRGRNTDLSILKRSRETELTLLQLDRTTGLDMLTRESELMTARDQRMVKHRKDKYDVLHDSYLTAALAQANKAGDIYMVAADATLGNPMPRHTTIRLGAALLTGALMAMGYVLLSHHLQEGEGTGGKIQPPKKTEVEVLA